MKNTIKQIFHSGKFVTGFVIFLAILLTIIIYPLVVAKDPLAMIGNGNFFKPGTYLSIQDTVNSGKTYKMNVDATASIVESKLTMDNRSMMAEWLEKYGGVDASEIDVTDAEDQLSQNITTKVICTKNKVLTVNDIFFIDVLLAVDALNLFQLTGLFIFLGNNGWNIL